MKFDCDDIKQKKKEKSLGWGNCKIMLTIPVYRLRHEMAIK
jgi:hypothetical protein